MSGLYADENFPFPVIEEWFDVLTMYEDGLRKALKGVTTFEEVLRVTRDA